MKSSWCWLVLAVYVSMVQAHRASERRGPGDKPMNPYIPHLMAMVPRADQTHPNMKDFGGRKVARFSHVSPTTVIPQLPPKEKAAFDKVADAKVVNSLTAVTQQKAAQKQMTSADMLKHYAGDKSGWTAAVFNKPPGGIVADINSPGHQLVLKQLPVQHVVLEKEPVVPHWPPVNTHLVY